MKLNNYKTKLRNLLKNNNNNPSPINYSSIEKSNKNSIKNFWKSENPNKHLISKIILTISKSLLQLQKLLKNLNNSDNK